MGSGKFGCEERKLYEQLRALTGKTMRHFWNWARFYQGLPGSMNRGRALFTT